MTRRRAGETRAATSNERRAIALAQRSENPATPPLHGVRARATLTAGERDTALLAARGLPSRQIADQLHLSVRTIENRLQRVYEKLGINRRGELADAVTSDRSHDPTEQAPVP